MPETKADSRIESLLSQNNILIDQIRSLQDKYASLLRSYKQLELENSKFRKSGRPTLYTPEQDEQLLASSTHGLSDLAERWGKSVLALLSRRNKLRAKAKGDKL